MHRFSLKTPPVRIVRARSRMLLTVTLGLVLAALAATAILTASADRHASAAGPFIASGLYNATFTAAFPAPINPVHSNCIFRIDTDTAPNPDVANMRAVCYVVAKTNAPTNDYPAPPPPPPPPYTPLLPPIGLNILSGDINAVTGAITLQFSPSLCLPVDNNPNDGVADGGIVASLTTSVNKAGVLQPGNVQLQTDRTSGVTPPTLTSTVLANTAAPFTMNVTSTAGFDAGGGLLLIDSEGFNYDSLTGTTFHITARHVGTTIAAQHNTGAAVNYQLFTCNDFNPPDTITGPFNPTSRPDADDDGDGCLTSAELTTNPGAGGLRDPSNPFDYSDINHDGSVNINTDILGVASAFGPTSGPRYVDYKDRGLYLGGVLPSVPLVLSWNMGPPNGAIDINNDVLGTAKQFGNTCAHSHPAAGTAPPLTRYGAHPTSLTAAVGIGGAPLAISVSNTAGFPTTGQILIDGETMTYDQTGGACGTIAANTQFCVTVRGAVASHVNASPVFHQTTTVALAVAAGTAAPFKMDVGTTAGWATAGYLRVDGEVMRYDQSVTTGGCAGLNSATQFCVTERPCDNHTDDDNDGWVNDGCAQAGATSEDQGQCTNSTNDDPGDDAFVNDGCPQFGATAESGPDCNNATDDDGDGRVNDGCPTQGTAPENPQCANNINDDPGDDTKVNDGCPQAGTAVEGGSAHAVGAKILPQ